MPFGLFDDLIPAIQTPPTRPVPRAVGAFDDLIPAPPSALAAPAPQGAFDDLIPESAAPTASAAPPPGPTDSPANAGAFDDLVPTSQPSQPFILTQSLTNAPVPLGERFVSNVKSAFNGTLLGSAANYLAEQLAPDTTPIDPNTGQPMGGSTPREQVRQSVLEDQARAEQLPGWQQEHGMVNQALAGGTALAGQLVGGAASPESLVAGPESYEAVRGGEAVLPALAKSAGVQAAVQGTANAGAQGLNIAGGTQDQFSPAEVGQAAGTGALIGAAAPAVGAIVNRVRGVRVPEGEAPVPAAVPPTNGTGAFDDLIPPEGKAPDETPPAAVPTQPEAPAVPPAGEPTAAPRPADETTPAPPPTAEAEPAPAPRPTDETTPAVPPAGEPAAPRSSDETAPTDANAGTVTTATGRKVDVRYEVAPAADLVPATGDLQPRERADRAASDVQIQSIAANLDPARLMRAPEADRGAPIVGPDNIIESGNGRVQAIQRAASQNPEAYARYVQALRDAGHQVDGIDTPVLVARRVTDMSPSDRRAFVQEANQSATQRLSAPEQARVDGLALTPDLLAKYDHTQDPTSAANRPFVRDWVATIPEAERNSVMDAHGILSADGRRRLNGAMLARAYDDTGVLARGLESTDDATRSVSGALADAAPAWAGLRASIEGKEVPPEFDTSKQLVQAADIVRAAREKRQTMSDVLNQQDAFNKIDPVTEQYVRALYNPEGTRSASRPMIADTLKRYAAEAKRQTTSAGLLGDETHRVTPVDALKAIVGRRDAERGNGTGVQGSMFGGDKLAADDRPVPLHDDLLAGQTGPTRSPLGGVRPERDFNAETSPYRQVFTDAGKDPDQMVSRPLPEQNKVIADHIKSAFGFKDVEVDPKQHPKEVRDQLSNFYNSGREMANAVGMPYSGIGLDGRVKFTTKPYRQADQALGTYAPRDRTITIPGRSNSFAHEWTHALDHYLSDALANNPKAMKLLSDTKGLGDGRVGGKPVLPGTPAEAFVNVMKTIFGKDAATAAEALKLQYEVRSGRDPAKFLAARARLDQIETDFAKNAKAVSGPKGYWARPAEMLARAHEAYVSEMIQRAGGDTRAVAKPYYDDAGAGQEFAKFYPQQGERDQIFQAFTDLHDQLRAQDLLGAGGAGARPDGLDIVDPHVWDKMSDPKLEPGRRGVLKREIQAQKNFRSQFLENMGFNKRAADPGRLGVLTRAADAGRALTYSIRGIGNVITKRQPEGAARDAFQAIMDQISPAEHLRSAEDAKGRYVGPVYEQEVREHARPNINRLANILDQHGLASMSDEQKLMLRHVLTKGDTAFVPDGATRPVPVPPNISKAAGALRYLLDQEWERNTKAGIDVGYAKSGYWPRTYLDTKIFGDRPGFERQAAELHRVMFEQDVGNDPVKLLEAHDRLPKDVREGVDPDVQDGVANLRRNLRIQDKLREQIEAGTGDATANQAQLDALQKEAGALRDQIHDPVRDLYAGTAATDWWMRINTGDPTDFDRRGPNARYTNRRMLPPEADAIMRDYMETDPTVALPRYFQQSARRVAFANRFGVNGAKLDALLTKASAGGARGEDIAAMRRLAEAVTGRIKSGLPPEVERASNVIHALGSIALMGRAAWSSLSEPMALLARTGSMKATMQAFASQLGDIARTAGSKQRAELANALGITVSHLQDSVIADRTEAQYVDAPGLSKLMSRFYSLSGLTQLTNSQRRSVMAAGHTALDAWSKDFLGGNARLVRDAAAQFRDLGVPDAAHADFARWVTEHPGLPSLHDLDTAGGRLWGQAVSRLTDMAIQDPGKVDKPLMSQNPIGRLAYGLMSFNYAFFHNVIEHTLDTHMARVREGYADVRAAGGNKLQAVAGTAAPIARAGAHISASAAAIYAGAYASTVLREALLNQTQWQQHEDDGTLGDWLSDLAFQRTGFNGPLDPVAQAITGLKYERDLSGLMAGAQAGYFLQAAGNMLAPLSGAGSDETNTARYNAAKGAWNMFGVPAAGAALSALPGGPLTRAVYGAAMQAVTSRGAADAAATAVAGPKGTGNDGTPPTPPKPKDPDAPAKGTGAGALGGFPVGLLDDVAAPAVKVATPLFTRLPRAGKIGVGLAVGVAGASALAQALSNPSDDQ